MREGGPARRVFLVHGEEKTALDFAETLRERGGEEVAVPERGASYEL